MEAMKSLYNNSYGYGVYKKSQVKIGNPFEMKVQDKNPFEAEKACDEASVTKEDFDNELLISQDIVHKAKEEAAIIIREAELEAERRLIDAKSKAENLFSETEQKAKEEGYRYGETLAQQHYNDLLEEAQDFKERTKLEYEQTLSSLEQEIVNIVLDIASKVIGDEVKSNSKAILGIVSETINSCTNHEHVVLKISADDYEIVAENEDKLRSMIKDLDELEIRKDNTLSKGSCIIDTGFGSVDGSADVRMENIKNAFYEILHNLDD